jgi:hypothetical protein
MEGIFHVVGQVGGDPFPSFNFSTMHTSIASSINIIDRLVDEHKLVQELGEAFPNIELVKSLNPLHSQ